MDVKAKFKFKYKDRELREKTEVEKAIEQFHFPLTPDEFKEEMEKYDIRKEELKELLEEAKKHRREVIEKEYKSEK